MKVLFDENLAYDHAKRLPGHQVFTAEYMGWQGYKDSAIVEKAASHGFQAIVSKDRDKELEKANVALGSPLRIIEVAVPKDVRREQVEAAVAKQMPQVLKQLNEHQRTLDPAPERGLEDIRSIVERVAQSMGVTLPTREQEPTDAERELKAFEQVVRGLCDKIAEKERDKEPEWSARPQRATPKVEKRQGPALTEEKERDRGHEW